MKKVYFLFAIFILACSIIAGCGGSKGEQSTEKNDGVNIVTSFYPMYVAALNITNGVEGVTLTNMTEPQTGCLHDYQLSTADMTKLEKADVFIINGAGMESFMEKVTSQQKNLKIIDASKDIPLLEEDGEANPHVWLSVTNEIQQVKNITAQLKEADPKNADAYQKNADSYIAKLEALKSEMHAAIDSLSNKDIITFHEAFPYFAKEFSLNIISVVEREPGTEPTPVELKEIIEQVNGLPTKVLFTEPQYSPSAAEAISRETGAKIYSLDPVVTGEATPAAINAYIDAMKKNTDTLVEALK